MKHYMITTKNILQENIDSYDEILNEITNANMYSMSKLIIKYVSF